MMVLAIAVSALLGPAGGDLRKEIQARYDDLSTGMRKKDPKILRDTMTPDFSGDTPEGGKMTREQAVKDFIGVMTVAKDAKWSRKVAKVTLKGTDAIAIVDGHFEGKMPAQGGKLHPMELKSRVEDTWVKSSGKWQVRRSHMLKMTMSMDGKVIQAK